MSTTLYIPKMAVSMTEGTIAEWLANGRQLHGATKDTLTVAELILAFWHHAELHYRDEHRPRAETCPRP